MPVGLGNAVSRYRRVGLADKVINRAVLVVVVGATVEAPGIAVIRPRVGVRRAAHVDAAACRRRVGPHAGNRVGRRVRIGVIRHAVSCHHDRRVGLVDVVVDRAALVVVVGRTGEAPGIAVIGARRWCASCRSR